MVTSFQTENRLIAIFPYYFYRALLCRAWLCHSMSSIRLCDVQVPWSHRLEYFENHFTAE